MSRSWRHRFPALIVGACLVASFPTGAAQKKKPPSEPAPVLLSLPELSGTVNSQPSGLNDSNVIVGTMWDGAGYGTAVVWIPEPGGWRLQVIEGGWLHPAGPFPRSVTNDNLVLLNRHGGETGTYASVWVPNDDFSSGAEIRLPTLGGRCCSYGEMMADNGLIIGMVSSATDASGRFSDVLQVVWVPNAAGGWDVFPLEPDCRDDLGFDVRCEYHAISRSGEWIAGAVARQASNGWWGRAATARISPDGVVDRFEIAEGGDLPDPADAPVTGAMMVNDWGESAGYYWPCRPDGTFGCVSEGAFWDSTGQLSQLPAYRASSHEPVSGANGMNDAGQVVGWALFKDGRSYERAAAWWRDPAVAPVKLGVSRPFTSGEAVAVNNSFIAVGQARGTGAPHAVVWILPQ